MPIPAAIAAAGISAAGGAGTSIFNFEQTKRLNKHQEAFSREMYDRQRRDALADWTMQNDYNSPQAQMQRLKDAGLNPNLVYGNGAVANSTSSIRSSQAPTPSYKTPEFDSSFINRGLATYMDWRMKDAQLDNLMKTNTVLDKEAALKEAQIVATLTSADSSKTSQEKTNWDMRFSQSLADINTNIKEQSLKKLEAETQMTLDENERRALTTSQNLEKGVEQIIQMRLQHGYTKEQIEEIKQRVENMKKSGQILNFEVELNKKGFTKSDPYYFRVGSKIVDGIMSGLPETVKKLDPSVILDKSNFSKEKVRGFIPWIGKKLGLN